MTKEIEQEVSNIDLEAVRWLRMRRATMNDAGVPEFRRDLRAVRDDLTSRPGNGVGEAIGFTIGAIVLAVVAVTLGWLVMDVASGMIGSFLEGAGR